jgi:hypothetical protein
MYNMFPTVLVPPGCYHLRTSRLDMSILHNLFLHILLLYARLITHHASCIRNHCFVGQIYPEGWDKASQDLLDPVFISLFFPTSKNSTIYSQYGEIARNSQVS